MNYLAHAYLSFGDTEILAGNMIADYVKGSKPLELLPKGIANGIHLHRKIDAFTDIHPAVSRARIWFREPYHLYASAILDTLWDHFLANDPAIFASDDALKIFSTKTYAQLEETSQWHPEKFAKYFPYMKEQNWLYNYRSLHGAKRSLEGLGRRARYMAPVEKAYETFIGRYYQLSQCYFELMDDLMVYVKNERLSLST